VQASKHHQQFILTKYIWPCPLNVFLLLHEVAGHMPELVSVLGSSDALQPW